MNGGGRMRELLAICLRLYLCLLQQRTSKFRDRAIFFVLAMLLFHVLAGKFHRVTERFRMLQICL